MYPNVHSVDTGEFTQRQPACWICGDVKTQDKQNLREIEVWLV